MKRILILAGSLVTLAITANLQAAPFTAGNIVVYRVGNGSTNLNSGGNAVFLDEYDQTGNKVQSIPVSTNAFASSGASTTEGLMTLSTDGRYLVFCGYSTNQITGSLPNSTASGVPRVIARADALGNVDTSTRLTDFANSTVPRGAASDHGTNYWCSAATGLQYAQYDGTISTQITASVTNIRGVNIFSNQLYASSQSGAFRIYTVGPGLPTIAEQVCTNLPGLDTSNTSNSPMAFVFFKMNPGIAAPVDTLYFADSSGGSSGISTTTNGLYKYSLVGGTWVQNGYVILNGAIGVTGNLQISGGSTNVNLYVTSAASGNSSYLDYYTDSAGWNQPPTGNGDTMPNQYIYEATVDNISYAFRGVALVPSISGAAYLSVSAPAPFNAAGFKGGPFSPSSIVYTVANVGTTTMTWGASIGSSWLSLSATSGTLGSGQTTTITASINGTANGLNPGSYSDAISFTNATNGGGNLLVPVTLAVAQLGVTPVTPAAGSFYAVGPGGGPFTFSLSRSNNVVFTLTNGTSSAILWGASGAASNWLSITPVTSGTLSGNGSVNITVSITNATALGLNRGTYADSIAFTNGSASDPGNVTLPFTLNVGGGFTSNNLVIYRAGDGSASLGNVPTPAFLDEFTRGGTFVQSVPLPTTNYSCSGSSTTEGFMTRSADKHYFVFVGYGTNASASVSSLNTTVATAVPRVVGRVDGNGNIDVTTRLTDFCSGSSARSAVSTNGIDMWVGGAGPTNASGGVRHTTLGSSTSSVVSTNPSFNIRGLGIFGGQLYYSRQAGGSGAGSTGVIAVVGSGLPTGDTVATLLPGFPYYQGSPYQFVMFKLKAGGTDPVDTLYVADNGGNTGGAPGGIYKYSLVGGNWVVNGTNLLSSVVGVVGDISISGTTTNVNLFVTTSSAGSGGGLYSYTDSGGWSGTMSAGAFVKIATPGNNTAFRSVSLATENPTLGSLSVSVGNFTVVGTPLFFTPTNKVYTLSNVGNSSMNWAITWNSTWFSVSATNGTLVAGGNTNITVSLNGNAYALPPGTYNDNLVFENTSNGDGNTARAATLTVGAFGFCDDFSTYLTGNLVGQQGWGQDGTISSLPLQVSGGQVRIPFGQTNDNQDAYKDFGPVNITEYAGVLMTVTNAPVESSPTNGANAWIVSLYTANGAGGANVARVNANDVGGGQYQLGIRYNSDNANNPYVFGANLYYMTNYLVIIRAAVTNDGSGNVYTNVALYVSNPAAAATTNTPYQSQFTAGSTFSTLGGFNISQYASTNGAATIVANAGVLISKVCVQTNFTSVYNSLTGAAPSDPFSTWQSHYWSGGSGNPSAAAAADPDADGMSNTNEFLSGFNPTNNAAYLHIISVTRSGTNVTISYLGASGDNTWSPGIASRTNYLEYTIGTGNGSYATNNFTSVQTNVLSGGSGLGQPASFIDTNGAAGATRYYRVRVLVP